MTTSDRFRTFLPGFLAGLALLSSAAGAAPSNKQLVIGVSQEFENLNPIISQMSASQYIYYMVSHPLVAIDAEWQWRCWLCTDLPTLENGRSRIVEDQGVKKLESDWEIRADAVWGDGRPVTGEDVRTSWEIGRHPNISTGSKDTFERIESIKTDKANPKRFTIRFREPRYDYYQLGGLFVLPAHLEGPVFERTRDQTGSYEKQTLYNTEPLNPGLYNGPYLVKEIRLGSHVVLERNPKYPGKRPAIERLVIKLIPNTQTLEANLLSGTIDMISELGMTFDQALAFEKRAAADPALAKRFRAVFVDGMIYEHIDFNLRHPQLADRRVRQALLYGIDRDKLCAALFEGRQKPALSMIHPRDIYYTTDVETYAHDPAKAAALLAEAGFKPGPDGILARDGQKLSLSLMTTAQNKSRELVQVHLQGEWRKLGVEIRIQNEPARVFFGETVKQAKYPGMAMYAWVSAPDSPPRSSLHSQEIPTAKNGWSGQNSGGFANPRVDAILEAVFREFDAAKRKALMAELQRIYTTELPVMPLYMRAELAVVPQALKGFRMTGHQYGSSLTVDAWEIEESGRGH